jgi:putative oxidoreductase
VTGEKRRVSEVVYALMRVVLGLLFACHGAQKLLGAFGKEPVREPLMILAGVIELGGGLLIAAGLVTRVAAFLASGQMAVAYFMAHAPDGFWPILNQGELAVVYCFVFLLVAALGGGRYSLDSWIRSRKPPEHGLREAALRMANR